LPHRSFQTRVRTIRQFDERFVAPAFGFADADDYAQASSIPYIARIRIPTLIIHAEDDPFVPFTPLLDPSFAANPYVLLIRYRTRWSRCIPIRESQRALLGRKSFGGVL